MPADLPAFPAARRVPPPADAPETPLPHPPFVLVEDSAALAALCARLAPAGALRGRHRDRLRPARRARRLVARGRRGAPPAGGGAVGGEIVCGVVDCYQVAPRPLLRLLADGREIIAHNARYEQSWLTWQFGLPPWQQRLRHELRVPRLRAPLVDPGSGLRAPRRHARNGHAQAARRAEGRLRPRLVGRRAAARRRSSTTPPTTRSRCSSCASARAPWQRPSAARSRCSPPRAPPAGRRLGGYRPRTRTPGRRPSS